MATLTKLETLFNKIIQHHPDIKLTQLRKDILSVFAQHNKPIAALDILKALKEMRDSAEPPTVYRVIDYLIKMGIVHKINSENKFILCNTLHHNKQDTHNFLLVCKKCLKSKEVFDEKASKDLVSIAEKNNFHIENMIIEVEGYCSVCKK